ncbi:glycohydrolase toxin TNT-related protein [Marinoscillum sp.]|uniref:glycohydrolase toxin TNT-related protein n=1 Tax=Marinoscillum sp. TaxID=2024838 RepID=UPI003BAD100A
MFKNLFKRSKQKPDSKLLAQKVNDSTLKMLFSDLYMHYYDVHRSPDPTNPEWQNQGCFFWKADEPFERKSLPPHFTGLDKKHFTVNDIPSNISVSVGTAAPWFGMPGGGQKYCFKMNNQVIPISDLINNGSISYIEEIELSDDNLSVLHDRDNYLLLVNPESVRYVQGNDSFYVNEEKMTLGQIFTEGYIKVIKAK